MCQPMAQPQIESGADVIKNGKSSEKTNVLKGSRNSPPCDRTRPQTGDGLSIKVNRSGRGPINTGNDIEDGCFSCAIGSDQADEIARTDSEIEFIDRGKTAETNGALLQIKQAAIVHRDRLCLGVSEGATGPIFRSAARRGTIPNSPCGRSSISAMRIRE